METVIHAAGKFDANFLGNFLSGMETEGSGSAGTSGEDLGNFLSGMETRHRGDYHVASSGLENFLVEWKHIGHDTKLSGSRRTSSSSIGSFFKSFHLFGVIFGVYGTRHNFAPVVTFQEPINSRFVNRMTNFLLESFLNFLDNRNMSLLGLLNEPVEQFFFFFDGQVGSASFGGMSAQSLNAFVDKGRPEDANSVGVIARDRADLFGRHAFGDSEQDTLSPAIFLDISDMLEKLYEFIDPMLRDGTLWAHAYHLLGFSGLVYHIQSFSKAIWYYKPAPNHPWKQSFRKNGHSTPAQSDPRGTLSLAIDINTFNTLTFSNRT